MLRPRCNQSGDPHLLMPVPSTVVALRRMRDLKRIPKLESERSLFLYMHLKSDLDLSYMPGSSDFLGDVCAPQFV